MERVPVSKAEENELTFDELASALEGVIITITDCKRGITDTEEILISNQKEYDELVGMLNPAVPEDKAELEKINVLQDRFVSTMHQDISRMKTIISELELIHGRELKMFEDLKAAQREQDFGSSGTAH